MHSHYSDSDEDNNNCTNASVMLGQHSGGLRHSPPLPPLAAVSALTPTPPPLPALPPNSDDDDDARSFRSRLRRQRSDSSLSDGGRSSCASGRSSRNSDGRHHDRDIDMQTPAEAAAAASGGQLTPLSCRQFRSASPRSRTRSSASPQRYGDDGGEVSRSCSESPELEVDSPPMSPAALRLTPAAVLYDGVNASTNGSFPSQVSQPTESYGNYQTDFNTASYPTPPHS